MNKDKNISTSDSISPFERSRRTNAADFEHWSSRDFASILGYTDYRNFESVIGKARLSCFNSGHRIEDHFVDVTEMVTIGSGAQILDHRSYGEHGTGCQPVSYDANRGKLWRDKVKGKDQAHRTHFEVGAKVRKTIEELGGTMPEDLPRLKVSRRLQPGNVSNSSNSLHGRFLLASW